MADKFDLIVIGAGSAARDAAAKASREHDARVALIERTRWGGSCPNVACRPTKAYLVAAELAYSVNELSDWMGIDCGPARVDLARVRAWKDSIRRAQESWIEVLREAGYELFPGEATFVDAHTLRVGDEELAADRILIASGSRTAVPRVPGIDEVDWIDHVTALELEEIPESLLVVGGGPVGLEFAQIFARFGSRVTIVNRDSQIAGRSDTEAANELHAALEDEGIEIVLESAVESFAGEGDTTVASLTGGGEVRVARVLLASGRVPNTEELAPEHAGVETDRGYVVVDDHQRTSAEGIWAAGGYLGLIPRDDGPWVAVQVFESESLTDAWRELDEPWQVSLELAWEALEDAGRDALALTNEPEEQVLRADVRVAQPARLVDRQLDDLLGDERRARDRLDHGELAALDAPRDLDLALAREQRHGAHLAQVHADGVVRLVERARREIEIDLVAALALKLVVAVALLGIDDFDARAAEGAEQVVELLGRRDVGREQLVDLVVQQIPFFLADGDELSHLIVFFFDRQRHVLLNSALSCLQPIR